MSAADQKVEEKPKEVLEEKIRVDEQDYAGLVTWAKLTAPDLDRRCDGKDYVVTSLRRAVKMLSDIFESVNICTSHGIQHAVRVMGHAIRAVACSKFKLTRLDALAIILAALLHDADDRKFFPKHKNFENARKILRALFIPALEEPTVAMIDLVSMSKNGNSRPPAAVDAPWILWPRWADRLEAGGWVGVVRCWDYTLSSGTKLFIPADPVEVPPLGASKIPPLSDWAGFVPLIPVGDMRPRPTPRASSADDVWAIATKERQAAYKGDSESMIDHYYDKLLRVCDFSADNEYLDAAARSGTAPLMAVVIMFGKTGALDPSILALARVMAELEAQPGSDPLDVHLNTLASALVFQN